MSVAALLGAIVLALAMPGEAAAMPGHEGHMSSSHAMTDPGVPDSGARNVHVGHGISEADAGGCPMGLMADCCVMTCCSATVPEITPGAVRHVVVAARSSRPTIAHGRAILPPLKPPKPVL